eukprot:6284094-Alexandrium_andersonii.AAC.1
MAGHIASSRVGGGVAPPRPPPKSASWAPAGLFRRHHRNQRAKWRRTPWMRPCRVEHVRPLSGPRRSSSESLKQ